MMNINANVFSNIKLAYPGEYLLTRFSDELHPFLNEILINSEENLTLGKIKNYLTSEIMTRTSETFDYSFERG